MTKVRRGGRVIGASKKYPQLSRGQGVHVKPGPRRKPATPDAASEDQKEELGKGGSKVKGIRSGSKSITGGERKAKITTRI